MVVHNFDIVGIAIPPLEADSIAVIDADAILPFPVGFERFQMEARRHVSPGAPYGIAV
jgi:hypothetical protein